MNKNDIKIDTFRGASVGGQHANKKDTGVRATHLPTGLVVTETKKRSQNQNKREAIKELAKRVEAVEQDRKAAARKARRDDAIKTSDRVRTYNFSSGVVTDHRTKKTASVKDILGKGLLDKLK